LQLKQANGSGTLPFFTQLKWTGAYWALCAVTMALLTNRLDLCIQGFVGAGKSKSMAILILALIELDVEHKLKILFLCKENSGTRSFADLLHWLDPPVLRLGRLVGDQENEDKCSVSACLVGFASWCFRFWFGFLCLPLVLHGDSQWIMYRSNSVLFCITLQCCHCIHSVNLHNAIVFPA